MGKYEAQLFSGLRTLTQQALSLPKTVGLNSVVNDCTIALAGVAWTTQRLYVYDVIGSTSGYRDYVIPCQLHSPSAT